MPNFQSKCVVLSANSVFVVQISGMYPTANNEAYLYTKLIELSDSIKKLKIKNWYTLFIS